jgi:hypothetical protein
VTSFRLEWTLAVRNELRLPSFPKHLALTLGTYMDIDGVCYPGVSTLAAAMSVDRRTVQRHLWGDEKTKPWLTDLGYLVIVPGGGKSRPHVFHACLVGQTAAQRRPLEDETAALVHETAALVHRNGGTAPPELFNNSSMNLSERSGSLARASDRSQKGVCQSCEVGGGLHAADCQRIANGDSPAPPPRSPAGGHGEVA